MTLDEFENQVISTCAGSPIVVSVAYAGSGITWLRLRTYLIDESFVEAFFNEETQRTAFAWIKDGTRVLGADNTGGWHWHPLDAPEDHIASDVVISFTEFFHKLEENLV
jgi:hypothetical protein